MFDRTRAPVFNLPVTPVADGLPAYYSLRRLRERRPCVSAAAASRLLCYRDRGPHFRAAPPAGCTRPAGDVDRRGGMMGPWCTTGPGPG